MSWIRADNGSYINLTTATAIKQTGEDAWVIRDGGGDWFNITMLADDLHTLIDDDSMQIMRIADILDAMGGDIARLANIADRSAPRDDIGEARTLRMRGSTF